MSDKYPPAAQREARDRFAGAVSAPATTPYAAMNAAIRSSAASTDEATLAFRGKVAEDGEGEAEAKRNGGIPTRRDF
jgi:hypothetical protein